MDELVIVVAVVIIVLVAQGALMGFLEDYVEVFKARMALLCTKVPILVLTAIMVAMAWSPASAAERADVSPSEKGSDIINGRAQEAPPLPMIIPFVPYWVIREEKVELPLPKETKEGKRDRRVIPMEGRSRRSGRVGHSRGERPQRPGRAKF